MPLILGQIIYTSFTKVGFKTLLSPNIPTIIEQAFIEQVVHKYWDSYKPISPEYRAAYIHEVSLEHNLFGWLYNDGVDDLGRSNIPYFICYYLPGVLDSILLENIFNCLQKGPLEFIDRHSFVDDSVPVLISDLQNYQPAKVGVKITLKQRDQYYKQLHHQHLLSIFMEANSQNPGTEPKIINSSQQDLYLQASDANLLKQADEHKDLSPNSSLVESPNSNLNKIKPYTNKIALLIGISESGFGFEAFPNAQKDIEAMERVLQNPELGKFNQVKTLLNPNKQKMEEAIETTFLNCQEDDLVFIYFSGQAIKGDNNKLYLHTSTTSRNAQNKLIKSSAVLATFVQDVMNVLPCKNQILILDAVWLDETYPEELLNENDISLHIENQFSGEGRIIITASTSAGYLLEPYESDISDYTHYFVEGMETGVAALDNESVISIRQLHEYALKRIKQATPTKKPEIYGLRTYQDITLANAPIDRTRRKYRYEVEKYIDNGDISLIGRSILSCLRKDLGLLPEEASAIEAQVLAPFQEYKIKLQCYTQEFVKTVYSQDIINNEERRQLKKLQTLLGIKAEDACQIESQCLENIKTTSALDSSLILNATPDKQNDNLKQANPLGQLAIYNSKFAVKNQILKFLKITLPIFLITIYTPFQLRDYETIKTIEASIEEKNYQNCLALTPSIGQISIYYFRARQLYDKCVIGSDLKTIWSIAVTPAQTILATANSDNTIKLWDTEAKILQNTLSGHSDRVWSVAISPDGKTLASGSGDKTIKLWNLETGKLIRILHGHKNIVRSLAISPNGQLLASGSYDRTLKIWNLHTGELIQTISGHARRVSSIAISPDRRFLASGSYDRTIKIWNLYTGALIHTLSGHTDRVTSIAISPDAQTIVSSGQDHTIKLWNLDSGKLIRTLTGHSSWVNAIAISPDGKLLASGDEDHLVIIWDLQTGKLLRKISEHSEGVYSVAISPDSRSVISGDKAGIIKIHPLQTSITP